MSLNRRQFLKASGVALCAGMLPRVSHAATVRQLPVPPLIESKNGRPVFLAMQSVNWAFDDDQSASVWGFNGQYLGPTVRVNSGDNVKLTCSNRLFETVGLTISGLQAPGSIMNNSARIIAPDSSWAPVLPIRQAAATCWYHASTPKNSARQVYNGLAGMWIVEDSASNSQGLPNQYGVNDFPVILQDKHFSFSGVPEYKPPYDDGFLGDTLLTNGVHEPSLQVGKSWIRLRLLNASNSRRYLLSLSNRQPIYLIASDQGLLSTPLILADLYLAPGERKEILVDMTNTGEVSLITGERRNIVDRFRDFFDTSTILKSTRALTIKSSGLSPAIQAKIPDRFNVSSDVNYTAQQSRQFVLKNDGTINGEKWQKDRIDTRVRINSQERWLVKTNFPQAFHMQGAEFLIVSVNDKMPPSGDSGWKDTVWIDGQVELLVRFKQNSSDYFPFLYHSQNLEFADAGAIGQLVVS